MASVLLVVSLSNHPEFGEGGGIQKTLKATKYSRKNMCGPIHKKVISEAPRKKKNEKGENKNKKKVRKKKEKSRGPFLLRLVRRPVPVPDAQGPVYPRPRGRLRCGRRGVPRPGGPDRHQVAAPGGRPGPRGGRWGVGGGGGRRRGSLGKGEGAVGGQVA